jgi:TetR/AcrR family transcriptional regulator of autoinduction and epiphytic fitness
MLVRVMVSRFLQTPELAKEMFGNSKMFESLLRDWIRAAQHDGRLRDCDVPFASKQLLALLESFVVWPQLIKNAPTPSSSTRDKIANSAVEMFLKYYE